MAHEHDLEAPSASSLLTIPPYEDLSAIALESEERFRALVHNSSDIITLLDGEAMIKYQSPSFYRILGYSPAEVIGKNAFEFVHPEDIPAVVETFTQALQQFEVNIKLEYRFRHQEGHYVVLESVGRNLIHIPDIKGVVVNSRDITERRIAEESIMDLNQKLEERVQMRTAALVTANQQLTLEMAERQQIEASLRESEEKYRLLFNSERDAVALCDTKTKRFLDVNEAWLRLYGYPRHEVSRLVVTDICADPVSQTVTLEDLFTENNDDFPLRWHKRKNGAIFPVEISAGLFNWKGHRVMCTIIRDISERLRAEEEITQRSRQIMRNQNALMHLTQSDKTILELNTILAEAAVSMETERVSYWLMDEAGQTLRCDEVYSLTEAKFIPQEWVFTATEAPTYFSALRQLKCIVAVDAPGDPVMGAFSDNYLTPQGIISVLHVPIWIDDHLMGVLCQEQVGHKHRKWTYEEVDFATAIGHLIALMLEASKRRVTEENLRLSESNYRNLVEQASDAIFIFSPHLSIHEVNFCACELFGYPRSRMHALTIQQLVAPAEQSLLLEAPHLAELKAGKTLRTEETFLRPDGLSFVAEVSVKILANGNFLGIIHDITARKQAEEALRLAFEKQKELNELKSRFISMASHEFRTPLTTLLASAELLERYGEGDTEKKQKSYERIRKSVNQMTELLDDILIFGQAEAGKLSFTLFPTDLKVLCNDLLKSLTASMGSIHPLDVCFTNLPPTVMVDNKLLHHILLNLLTNAFKYSPVGSPVTFHVDYRDNQAIFRITDQGIGIAPEDMPRLFDIFYRAQNVGKIQGTGLGTAIVKECVDRHGGTIEVNSELNKGTTFLIAIPAPVPPMA